MVLSPGDEMGMNARDSLDRDASAWTPDTLHQAFLANGCAVVRQVVAPALLTDIRAAVERAYVGNSDVHIYDRHIQEHSAGRLSGFEVANNPLLKGFLDRVYAGQRYWPYSVTGRRIQGVGQNIQWQEPLDLHIDAQFHRPQFTVNFWVPLQDCGTDCPTLQVVPVDYRQTRQYVGYEGRPLATDPIDLNAVRDTFGPDCLLRPAMKIGDVVVASNWVIHGSYRGPAMTQGRVSIEVRFISRNIEIAPHLPPLARRLMRTYSRNDLAPFMPSSLLSAARKVARLTRGRG